MPGRTRAKACRVAAVSGLRVDERRSLTPESFRPDGPRACLTPAARDAKTARRSISPYPCRSSHRSATLVESVLPILHDTVRVIRADTEACGIRYETGDGVADFHSLPGFPVSALVHSGRPIKEINQLDRPARSTAGPAGRAGR
jgi:hypothetical protein